jgi:hypothetical protein
VPPLGRNVIARASSRNAREHGAQADRPPRADSATGRSCAHEIGALLASECMMAGDRPVDASALTGQRAAPAKRSLGRANQVNFHSLMETR